MTIDIFLCESNANTAGKASAWLSVGGRAFLSYDIKGSVTYHP